MKWLLIVWEIGGPYVGAVLSSEQACYDLAEKTQDVAAVRFCAELTLDNLASDVKLYTVENNERLRIFR